MKYHRYEEEGIKYCFWLQEYKFQELIFFFLGVFYQKNTWLSQNLSIFCSDIISAIFLLPINVFCSLYVIFCLNKIFLTLTYLKYLTFRKSNLFRITISQVLLSNAVLERLNPHPEPAQVLLEIWWWIWGPTTFIIVFFSEQRYQGCRNRIDLHFS